VATATTTGNFVIQLLDQFGNLVETAGQQVLWVGPDGTVNPAVLTNAQGQATIGLVTDAAGSVYLFYIGNDVDPTKLIATVTFTP
jgi:hypothetical protein